MEVGSPPPTADTVQTKGSSGNGKEEGVQQNQSSDVGAGGQDTSVVDSPQNNDLGVQDTSGLDRHNGDVGIGDTAGLDWSTSSESSSDVSMTEALDKVIRINVSSGDDSKPAASRSKAS